jgi:hypothetical protein
MTINERQITAVLAMPGKDRYRHFIKKIADSETVWGLFSDGWALAGTDDGAEVFPLWPAQEYAALCAVGAWDGYAPKSFTVDELLDDLLPMLENDGVLPGIFYTPQDKGVTPAIDLLRSDLKSELANYE